MKLPSAYETAQILTPLGMVQELGSLALNKYGKQKEKHEAIENKAQEAIGRAKQGKDVNRNYDIAQKRYEEMAQQQLADAMMNRTNNKMGLASAIMTSAYGLGPHILKSIPYRPNPKMGGLLAKESLVKKLVKLLRPNDYAFER